MSRPILRAALALAAALCFCLALVRLGDMRAAWQAQACPITATFAAQAGRALQQMPQLRAAVFSEAHAQPVGADWLPGRSVDLTVVRFVGDPRAIAHFPLLTGALPYGQGCAIDRASAYGLWHSQNAVGQTVLIGDQRLVVTGVMDIDRRVALTAARACDQLTSAAALGDVDALVAALGQQVDPWALGDAEIVRALGIIAALPIWLFLMGRLRTIRHPGWRRMCLLLAAVAALWFALDRMPPRLLPGRFSDFAFYEKLWDNWRSRPPHLPTVRDRLLGRDILEICLLSLGTWLTLGMERKIGHEKRVRANDRGAGDAVHARRAGGRAAAGGDGGRQHFV